MQQLAVASRRQNQIASAKGIHFISGIGTGDDILRPMGMSRVGGWPFGYSGTAPCGTTVQVWVHDRQSHNKDVVASEWESSVEELPARSTSTRDSYDSQQQIPGRRARNKLWAVRAVSLADELDAAVARLTYGNGKPAARPQQPCVGGTLDSINPRKLVIVPI